MTHELNTVRPSSAHRWMKCAYSAFAEGLLPRSSSPAAEIGTRTHAVAAQRLYDALKAAFPDADITAPPALETDAHTCDIYEDCLVARRTRFGSWMLDRRRIRTQALNAVKSSQKF